MTGLIRIRSACAGWAIGLAVLVGGIVPSWGQTPADDPRNRSKPNDQAAFSQAIRHAIYLANQKKYAEAIREASSAQEIARRAFGPTSEQADEALHVLRQFYSISGDSAAELRALRELRELRRQRLGSHDWRVKDVEARLALMERVTSLSPEQRVSLEKAVNQTVDQAASAAQQGRLDEALTQYQAALKRWRQEMPSDNTTTAALLTDLGQIELRRQEFLKARGFLEEALAVRKRLLGEQHPDVADTILKLARLAEIGEDLARARLLFETRPGDPH